MSIKKQFLYFGLIISIMILSNCATSVAINDALDHASRQEQQPDVVTNAAQINNLPGTKIPLDLLAPMAEPNVTSFAKKNIGGAFAGSGDYHTLHHDQRYTITSDEAALYKKNHSVNVKPTQVTMNNHPTKKLIKKRKFPDWCYGKDAKNDLSYYQTKCQ